MKHKIGPFQLIFLSFQFYSFYWLTALSCGSGITTHTMMRLCQVPPLPDRVKKYTWKEAVWHRHRDLSQVPAWQAEPVEKTPVLYPPPRWLLPQTVCSPQCLYEACWEKALQGMLRDCTSPASAMSVFEAGRISLDSDVQSLHRGCSPFLLNSVNDDLRLETSFLFVCAFSVPIIIKYLKLDKKC